MRAAWVAVMCACGASQHAAPVAQGHVSVAAAVDPKLSRKGTLFTYWMTKDEVAQVMSPSLDLTPLARMLDRLELVGEVDLGAGPVSYPAPHAGPDIIYSAVLDTQHDGIGSLLGAIRTQAGDLTGDSKPGSLDIALDQVMHREAAPEPCSGANHELVTLDAPEVAGAMGNDTHRRLCVVLPASYATGDRRYPVIYELPGWGSDDAHMIEMFKHDAIFADTKSEAILVLVDTSTKSGSSYLVDSPRTGAWDAYMAKRVIPAIDQRYRTIATRDGRATAGLSTGGAGSLDWGLRHPELIGVVTASSPDGPDIIDWLFGPPMPPWTMAMLRVEAATGGAGFFASYGNDWSPDDSPRGWALPIDLATGAQVPSVIAKWREHGSSSSWLDDPARAAQIKAAFDGRLCLTVGKKDEFRLYPALQHFADKLTARGIHFDLALADGGHIDPSVMTLVYRCAAQQLGIGAFNAAMTDATLHMNNAAVLALWDDDGISELPGQAPLVGKPAIAAFLAKVTAQLPGAHMRSFEMTCDAPELAGDVAKERCHEHQVVELGGGKPPFDGKGTVTFELHRGADGAWRARHESFEAD